MTRHAHDVLTLGGLQYSICAYENDLSFDQLEDDPGEPTATIPGHPFRSKSHNFVVHDQRLHLDSRRMFGSGEMSGQENNPESEALNHPVSCDGKMLVGRDEVPGFGNCNIKPWYFANVVELTFDNGSLTTIANRSSEIRQFRKLAESKTPKVELEGFVKAHFDGLFMEEMMPITMELVAKIP